MTITVLLGGHIPTLAGATALAIVDGTVAWAGDERTARDCFTGSADEVLDLRGALVTPAFVDAHVHATAAGLLATGPDLSTSRSLDDCLDTVARHAAARPGLVWGHGWDETRWPERRAPTRAELDRAAGPVPVYLPRVDAHSAAVSSALLHRAPRARDAQGWSADGPLTGDAHHHVRRAARESVTPTQRRAAQQAFCATAAARGVAVVHECAGPDISGAEDLADLLAADHGVEVVGYWGQAVRTEEQARELLRETGAHGLAGDLFCDGALGSRTAALCEPYADAPGTRGVPYLDAEQVAAHVTACTRAGVQAGFHVIGDAAADVVVAGFVAAEREVGSAALRRRAHRLEHLEMVDGEQIRLLAAWGVVASVQPAFDAAWGGTGGMYASRLGTARAAGMNPFARFLAAGVPLALGSDAPVTPVDPWGAVRAAAGHRTPGSQIGVFEAIAAHTHGGHRAAACADTLAGTLAPGAPASYAVWDAGREGTTLPWDPLPWDPQLPWDGELPPAPPTCLRTVHHGRVLFEREDALT